MATEERNVSQIRQDIINNANKSRDLKERERRIDAKRARLKREYELIKRHRRAHPVERVDDGNIRITIYIPRFLRTIILINWVMWFAVLPSLLVLMSGSPGDLIYVPVILLLSIIWLLIGVIAWYLYWWIFAITSTLSLVFALILIYTGSIEFSGFREAFQSIVGN